MASGSRWRAELLARLDLPFETRSPPFDERLHDQRFTELGPRAFALFLARGKAQSVAAEFAEAWVLGADQIAVVHDGDGDGPMLLHKPGSEAQAVDQLMRLRGRSHQLITAVVLLQRGPTPGAARELGHVIDEQRLTMRLFSKAEAVDYVASHQPLDSVGAYHIEDAGIRLFERIEGGDYTGIIGLPLLAVCRLLREAGLLPGSAPRGADGAGPSL